MEIDSKIPKFFYALKSVAIAKISLEGVLIEANAGFYNLLPHLAVPNDIDNIKDFFIQPSFKFLTTETSDKDQLCYQGLFTLGHFSSKTWTLEGSFYIDSHSCLMIVEHNVKELENMRLFLSDLNRDLAKKQRELIRINRELANEKQLVEKLSLTDPLTGLGNRRKLEECLSMEIIRTRREQSTCSIIMCDIDHFKAVNDDFGHDAGDIVLAEFAKLIIHHIRLPDLAIRFGGEEFIILMPGASAENTAQSAERLRISLNELQINKFSRVITASFGVTELFPDDTPEKFIKRADTAMYQAKENGRNRVVTISNQS